MKKHADFIGLCLRWAIVPRLRTWLPVMALSLATTMSLAEAIPGTGRLPGLLPGADEHGPVFECLKNAHDSLKKQGPYKAVEDFRVCARQFPDSPVAHFGLGIACFMARQQDQAVEAFKQVLKLDANNFEARAMLGKIYSVDKNKLSLAEELLKDVVKKNPYHFDARIDLARVLAQQKKMEQALREFALVLAMEKRFALYHVELGSILMAGGAFKQAREQFERALVLSPGFSQAEEQLKILDKKEAAAPARPAPGQGTPPAKREKP